MLHDTDAEGLSVMRMQIPKAMKEELAARGIKTGRSLLQQTVAAKDGTRKFLLQLADGRVVEAVGIPNDKDSRLTACVSSQAREKTP